MHLTAVVTAAEEFMCKRSKMGNGVGVFTAVNAISREGSFVGTQGTSQARSQKLLLCYVTLRNPAIFATIITGI